VLVRLAEEDETMEILGTGRHRVIGIIGLSVLGILVLSPIVLPNPHTSITWAKEHALQEDLRTMRLLIQNYTSEQRKRPESLQALVAAGYLKHIPNDPITGRDDTWIIERSSDMAMPGIVNVRSGASGEAENGSRYRDW
jgi:general secretion pathway protein G